jgi:hypothetical protein
MPHRAHDWNFRAQFKVAKNGTPRSPPRRVHNESEGSVRTAKSDAVGTFYSGSQIEENVFPRFRRERNGWFEYEFEHVVRELAL